MNLLKVKRPIGRVCYLSNQFEAIQKCLDEIKYSIIKDLDEFPQPIKLAATHYFTAKGKMIRPSIILGMSHVVNWKLLNSDSLKKSQISVAQFSEMLHTASLIHDDIVDSAEIRRNQPSVNASWGNKLAVLSGNLIMSRATYLISTLNDPVLICILTKVLVDLVTGEFMQLELDSDKEKILEKYIEKSFYKTGSLFAHTCKATCYLAGGNNELQEICYQFGRDLGIAFQLIDDSLDYVDSKLTGKPSFVDAKLGLATAPVLYAAETYPELYPIIQRKFGNLDDVNFATNLVLKSDGIKRTRELADNYTNSAKLKLDSIGKTPYNEYLKNISSILLSRDK